MFNDLAFSCKSFCKSPPGIWACTDHHSDLCTRHFGMWLFYRVLILIWSLSCDVLVSAALQQTAVMSSKENCDRIPLLSQNLYTYFFLKFSGLKKLHNGSRSLYSWNPSRQGCTNSQFDCLLSKKAKLKYVMPWNGVFNSVELMTAASF